MKFFARLEKSRDFWFLLITSFVFFLLRFPSLFEPYWYGDEGVYQTIGSALNQGRLLYEGIWDNKPPLLYVLYALFNGDQFFLKLLSILFGIGSIVAFLLLLKKLFSEQIKHPLYEKSFYIATAVFAILLALPLLEGNIANTENFMIIFPLIAAICLLRYKETKKSLALWYVGIFLSLETLFKVVGIFDFAAFGCFLFFTEYKNRKTFLSDIKTLIPFGIAYGIPILLTCLYFLLRGTFSFFFNSAFTQMVGYVGYGNMFFIPQGLLYIKILILLAIVGFLFSKRKKIAPSLLFIYLWLPFSLFSAFFSQRPYTHYVLLILPSFCLFIFLLLVHLQSSYKREQHTPLLSQKIIHIVIFIIITFLIMENFNIYKKNIAYYQNFLSFMSGSIPLTTYQNFFDPNVSDDYAIAQFIRTHSKEKTIVFLWGDTPQIYKMSGTLPPGRYTTAYHITGLPNGIAETAKALKEKPPRFIVLMSDEAFPFDLSKYRYVFSIQNNHFYERIF